MKRNAQADINPLVPLNPNSKEQLPNMRDSGQFSFAAVGFRPINARISRLLFYGGVLICALGIISGSNCLILANSEMVISTTSPTPQSGTVREYIYSGSRLIAIEEYAGTEPGPQAQEIGATAPKIVSTKLVQEGESFRLVVKGARFSKDSLIRVNGEDRQTKFIDSTQLSAVVSGCGDGQTLEIFVASPSEESGVSNKATNRWETR